jgi:4-hydroxybenzoate polyprenyltransferase
MPDPAKPQAHLASVLAQSLGYIGIVILCILGGLVANVSRPDNPTTWTDLSRLYTSPAIHLIIATILLFFGYFLARSMLLDRPGALGLDATKAWARAFILIYILALMFSGLFLWQAGAFLRFFLILAIALPPALMFFLTHRLEQSEKHADQAHKFLPKIFYPAFSICFLSFCLGWVISNPNFEGQSVIYFFSALIFLAFFLTYEHSTPTTIAVTLVVLILAIILASFSYKGEIGLCLLIGLLWTFSLGCAEVAKRPYLMNTREAIAAPGESEEFYIAGANWSSILFLNLLTLMPLFVSNNVMFAIILIVWMLIIVWHMTREKNSKYAYNRARLMGYLLPISIIILMAAGKTSFLDSLGSLSANDPFQTDRLITLLGVFLTIIFVLYPEEFRNMPEDIGKTESFLSRRSCLLFGAATIAIQAVLVTFIFSVLSATNHSTLGNLQFRVDIILMALILELVAILVLLLMVSRTPGSPNSSESAGMVASRPPNGAPTAQTKTQPSVSQPVRYNMARVLFLLIWEIGRLPVGLIAGAAVVFFVTAAGNLPWSLAVAHAIPILLMTMSGFALNDLYDIEKDRLAQADKPIAFGKVSVLQSCVFVWVLITTSILVAVILQEGRSYYVILAALFGVASYSFIAQKAPVLKGFATAILCCSPFAYSSQVAHVEVPAKLYILLIAFIMGRELLLDIVDLPGDMRAGIRTLAAYFRAPFARFVGWTLMFGSALLFSIYAHGLGRVFFIAMILSLAGSAWICTRNESNGLKWSRLSLLLGVLGAALIV